jgi:acetyltransferase-like isoleucine patch superfamily enzyme
LATPLDIVLVGAGRHGRNLVGMIEDHAGLRLTRVLDDAPAAPSVLGYPADRLADYAGPVWDAVLAIGGGDARRAIVTRPAAARLRWQRFFHPATHVSRHAEIGEGCTILPFSTVTACRLGAHVAVFPSCSIGSGAEIGDFTSLMPHVLVSSDARIGAGCTISAGARVLAGVSIGDRCVLAPNVVLNRDMPPDSLAVSRGSELRIVRRPGAGASPSA